MVRKSLSIRNRFAGSRSHQNPSLRTVLESIGLRKTELFRGAAMLVSNLTNLSKTFAVANGQSRGAFLLLSLLIAGFASVVSTPALAQTQSMRTQITTQADDVPSSKKLKLRWNLSLQGDSFSNEREQAQTTGFGIGGQLRYRLAQGLSFRASLGMTLQSGYSQSRFGDNAPRSGLDLREAVVQYRPFSFFAFEAGAIDQGQLKMPLLVSSRAFPGVVERVLVGDRKFGAELRAQQTVPTSTQQQTKTVEAEPMPSFLSETLRVRAMPTSFWTLRASATHFRFNQLPMRVALDSSPFGNTLKADQDRLMYQFQGYGGGGGTSLEITRAVTWNVDGHVVQNIDAPEGYNLAQLITTSFDLHLPNDIDLRPQAEIFFAESDVSPAFYNDSGYGHSNRRGYAADFLATFKQAGFKCGLRYVNADLIDQNTVQSAQQYVMLRFETLYDSLF